MLQCATSNAALISNLKRIAASQFPYSRYVLVEFFFDVWRHMVQKCPHDSTAVRGDVLISSVLVLDASDAEPPSGVIGLPAETAFGQ